MSVTRRSTTVLTNLSGGTVTFLSSAIEHSASDTEDVLRVYDAIFERCLGAHDGRLVELGPEGDSIVCVFARPSQALACAVAAQKEIARTNWPAGAQVRVRIAIHTGESEVRHGHHSGPALYRCARLLAIAHGGQTIVSGLTRDLVVDSLPDALSLRDLGVHRLKDLSRPEHVYQVIDPELDSEFPPLRSLDSRRTNLPEELTSFLGRETEQSLLKEQLARRRMVTVTGPGGMGKTRIAQRVASELLETFPDGAWFIALDALADPALLTQAVANALVIREVAGTELFETVCTHVQSWSCLLVLDNCEHVIEESAQFANRLLAGCPNVRILATSRQPTGATQEIVWRLPPLDEAVRLFVERAWPGRDAGEVDGERMAAIEQICRRLEGIPLAIELAAARARVMSVDELLVRLGDRLALLSGGPSAVPRHQTMRATVDWSYTLLDESERSLFRRLSVFAGGFTIAGVEAVCAGDGIEPGDVLDLLARLVDRSLVLPVEAGPHESPMRMLIPIQQYGQERLDEAGETAVYGRRHAVYFLDLSEQARDLQNSSQHSGRLDLLEREHDNLRVALATSQQISAELNLRLATALIGFWDERGHLSEGSEWLTRALATWPDETALRADALGAAGWLAQRRGDFDRAAEFFVESARIASAVGEPSVQARSLRNHALVEVLRAESRRALPLVNEAFAISHRLGDRAGTAGALLVMALAAYFQGDVDDARRFGEQSLTQHRDLGDEKVAAFILACLATLALDLNDVSRARANLKESLEISQQLHEKVDVAFVLESCARLAAATGEPAQAIRLAAAAGSIRRAAGAPSAPIWALAIEASLAPVREAVGDDLAQSSVREGASLTLEEAVDGALAWLVTSRHPAARKHAGPDGRDGGTGSGLTRRELEIAAFVGRGFRNREIAERLFVSVRTVDAHVEHIRDKLDFHSRAQIAAWAVGQGLVRD